MIYLDSSNVKDIERFMSYGIIDGVTSNPSIMLKDGVTDVNVAIRELIKVTGSNHLSVEVTTNDEKEMLEQAIQFSKMSRNIVVKIPIHGPEGELSNLRVLSRLCNISIKTNATCCMNAVQCIMAARVGADYVSLFGGRVNDMGYDACDEIKKFVVYKSMFNLPTKTKLIIGSVREVANVFSWLSVGADIVTVPTSILEKMLVHIGTKDVVKTFLEDAKRIGDGK